jgi:hypothetical protein
MRKLILIAAISQLILLTGCKGDLLDYLGGGSNNKKYTVNFRIGGLNHNVGEPNVGFQTEPIKNYITQLSIIVYDVKSGAEVARKIQSSTDLDFGQITFSLPSSNYHFVAAGSNTPFGINLFYQTPTTPPVNLPYGEAYMQYSYPTPYEGEKTYKTTDTFIAKVTSNITTNKSLDMIMQRVIGRIEVSFTDAPIFRAELRAESTAITFDSLTSLYGITRRPTFEVNTAVDGPFKLNILTTHTPMWLDIKPPSVISRPVFIPVEKNKTTKVTGNLLTEEYTIVIQ